MPQELHLGRERLAVLELDAVPPQVDVLGLHLALDLEDVGLRHGTARVHETFGEIAVVGREEDAARREVEASDGVDAATAQVL